MPNLTPSGVADPSVSASDRDTANELLLDAVLYRSLDGAKKALAAGAALEWCDCNDETALCTAAWVCKDWPMAAFLIGQGASLDVTRDGEHLLHLFARHNQLDLVRTVLGLGAPVDVQTTQKQHLTPLMAAVFHGHATMVAELLARGADVGLLDKYDNTALHYAADPHIIDQLLSAGANIDAPNEDGATPLMSRVITHDAGACRALLAHGANVNSRTHDGRTGLVHAAGRGSVDITLILLDGGADPAIGALYGHDFQWHCGQDSQIAMAYASWRAQQAIGGVVREIGLRGAPQ